MSFLTNLAVLVGLGRRNWQDASGRGRALGQVSKPPRQCQRILPRRRDALLLHQEDRFFPSVGLVGGGNPRDALYGIPWLLVFSPAITCPVMPKAGVGTSK